MCNYCVYLLFEGVIASGFQNVYETFRDYASNWHWPRRLHALHLADIFDTARKEKHRRAGKIKCPASDMLSLLCVLAVFAQHVLLRRDICNAECQAFLALVDLADLIVATARVEVLPATLLAAGHRFLHLYVTAFGYDYMFPKMHWLLHFAETLAQFGVLLNCFVLERKHRMPKRYADELKNTSKHARIITSCSTILANITSPEQIRARPKAAAGRRI